MDPMQVIQTVLWWLSAIVAMQSIPLSLVLTYRIRYWRLITAILSDLIRQPPPLILFLLLWWIILPMIINKAVRNQIASRRAAKKLIQNSTSLGGPMNMDHVVGHLLRSYPEDKLELLTMGAVDLG